MPCPTKARQSNRSVVFNARPLRLNPASCASRTSAARAIPATSPDHPDLSHRLRRCLSGSARRLQPDQALHPQGMMRDSSAIEAPHSINHDRTGCARKEARIVSGNLSNGARPSRSRVSAVTSTASALGVPNSDKHDAASAEFGAAWPVSTLLRPLAAVHPTGPARMRCAAVQFHPEGRALSLIASSMPVRHTSGRDVSARSAPRPAAPPARDRPDGRGRDRTRAPPRRATTRPAPAGKPNRRPSRPAPSEDFRPARSAACPENAASGGNRGRSFPFPP